MTTFDVLVALIVWFLGEFAIRKIKRHLRERKSHENDRYRSTL
jgi:hypothetical protein